jgi:hypothetical protein
MWRYLVGAVAALLLVGAGTFLFRTGAATEPQFAQAPPSAADPAETEQPDAVALPQASPKSREQRRFGRYDKDKDGIIAREEYLASRRKAYAKLDTNGDGRLSFEEWSTKTIGKFAKADRDRSGTLNPVEFATTAVKRTPRRSPCPPPQQSEAGD